MKSARVLPLAVFAAVLSMPSVSPAQTTGYAVNRFDPAEKGSDWFMNESLDLRGAFRPAIGVLGEYSTNQVFFYNYDGSKEGAVVASTAYLHLGASLTLFDRLRLGLNAPFALYQNGEALSSGGRLYAPPTKAALGDIRVGADVRLFGVYRDPFTVAVGAQVHLPSGSTTQFTGDNVASVTPRLMAAGDVGDFAYAARIGYEVRGRNDVFAGTQLGNEVVWGASVGLRGFDRHLLVGPELFGSTLAERPRAHNSPTELLVGMHYSWDDWRVGLGAGGGLGEAYGSPSVRVIAGIEWAPAIAEPKPSDRDGDGVIDAEDACPDVSGVRTDDPKTNGCPPPAPSDKDGDGVLDKDDACPDVAGVKTDDPKTNGCPPDKDGDGIADKDDACPDEAGVKDPDPKKNGCPPLAKIENGMIKISEQVQFKTNSAQILAASDNLMNAVLTIMKDHPEIKLVHIEGHTDNKGSAALNKSLSDKRARAVMNWLTLHGIDKARMDAKGYGPERPIDTNTTEEGRQKNRRVEFHIDDTGAAAKP